MAKKILIIIIAIGNDKDIILSKNVAHSKRKSSRIKTFACDKTPDKKTLDSVYQLTYKISRKLGRDKVSAQERAKQAVKAVKNTWIAWASDDEPMVTK
jgi:hypothetical protein